MATSIVFHHPLLQTENFEKISINHGYVELLCNDLRKFRVETLIPY